MTLKNALLVLEDGTTLYGTAFGADAETFGEMVFNTGMTGYQETLTDPSYCRQIVAMTAPHVGNTGVNDEDPESGRVWVSGYVVREPARIASSWRATRDLDAYLRAEGVPGIAVRGTRVLTRRVREQGAMRAAISTVESSPERLLERVLASPQMTGADLARVVSTAEPYTVRPDGPVRYRVVAVDLGIKASTPRNLAARGCEVLVVPATASAERRSWPPGRTGCSSATAPETRPRPATQWTRCAGCWTPGCPSSASAWAARSSRWPSACAPTSCATVTAA